MLHPFAAATSNSCGWCDAVQKRQGVLHSQDHSPLRKQLLWRLPLSWYPHQAGVCLEKGISPVIFFCIGIHCFVIVCSHLSNQWDFKKNVQVCLSSAFSSSRPFTQHGIVGLEISIPFLLHNSLETLLQSIPQCVHTWVRTTLIIN